MFHWHLVAAGLLRREGFMISEMFGLLWKCLQRQWPLKVFLSHLRLWWTLKCAPWKRLNICHPERKVHLPTINFYGSFYVGCREGNSHRLHGTPWRLAPVSPCFAFFQVRQRPLVGVVLAVAQHEVPWGKGRHGRISFLSYTWANYSDHSPLVGWWVTPNGGGLVRESPKMLFFPV